MHSIITSVTRTVTFLLVVSLSIGSASAAGTDTSKLRDDLTLDAIRGHQAAFQGIADANGGTRRTVSSGADESAAYVAAQLEAAGYDVTLQGFDFPYFEELSIPEFEQVLPTPTVYPHFDPAGFITMTYSGSGELTRLVEGVDIIIPPGGSPNTSTSGCDASDFGGFTSGNIALIQRGSCTFELKTFNAQNAGASAVIIFNEGQSGRTDAFSGALLTPSASIPVIATSYAIGEDLYTASMGPGGATVRIKVDTISEVQIALNVIAELPGHYDRVVMAGAHLDSVAAGPGINDNGSGSAALLEIALQMAQPQHKPRNTVRFAWWGAEEAGLAGSNFYVSNLSIDEIKKLNAYLELEMLGSPNFVRFVFDGDGSDFGTTGPEGSAMIEQMINDYFDGQGLPAEPTPINFRHSYVAFYSAGVPMGGLFGGDFGIKTADQAATFGGTAGDQYDPCYHLACDTFDNVNLASLDQMSDAAAHAIQTLAMGGTSTPSNGSGRLTCEQLGYDFSIKAEPDGCRQSSGFWKSNPEAWPVDFIDIGGVVYSKVDAIDIMNAQAKGDKTYSLFIETVAAKLNDMTCGPYLDIAPDIAKADVWLALYPPGSGIKSKDPEWVEGGAINATLSSFNGGSFMSGTWNLDGLATVEIETLDGIYFDWTSTRSADAVIVKGGRNVNLYEYDPEAFGDLGLHAPINSKNGTPYGLSYVEFCYDWDIDISVRKFNDLNNNGLWDDGEPEIGVEQFINPDGTVGGTNGWPYLFSFPMDTGFNELFWTPGTHQHSFAGVYTIQEQEFLLWDPTALIINSVPQPLSTQANIPYAGDADESVEVIFGNVGYAEILGRKFEDLNGNGVYDAGEPPVEDVEVTLTGSDLHGNPVLLTDLTDATGLFEFLELFPGTYSAEETDWPLGGWVPSTLTVSGPHLVDSGDSLDLDWVFGNLLPGSVHGYKFVDVNGNGVEDDGEPGLAGVTILLTGDVDGDGDIDQIQVTTNDEGEYWFTGLWPGDYTVEEIVPDGWVAVTPTSVNVTVVSGIELVAKPGQAMLTPEQIAAGYEEVIDERLVFGNLEPGSIHGYKFNDLDGDGVESDPNGDGIPDEPRLPGVRIVLTGDVDGDGDIDEIETNTSDPEGEFGFTDLYPGEYTVREEPPSGWIATTPTSTTLTVNSGEELVAAAGQAQLPPGSTKVEVVVGNELIFGNFELGSIHGFKFDDLDADGVWGPGEPRLAGWMFQLFDFDGNLVDEQISDENGEYGFTDLGPGDFAVREVAEDGWTQSTANPPPLLIFSGREYVAEPGLANLPPGSTKHEVVETLLAFGNFQTGSIHGYKFEDLDGDGIWDPGEPRLEGLEFELSDGDGNIIATETTNADGEFWFVELTPSVYAVREIVPDGWMGSTENPIHLVIFSGQEYVAEDGQAHLPPDSTKYETLEPRLAFGNFQYGSIHGLKFDDLDADGVRDANEPPLEGWLFELIDAAGNVIDSETTDVNGDYWFTDLFPGDYTVREVVQAGWMQSTVNPPPLFVNSGQEYVAVDGQAHLPPDSTKYETVESRLAFGNFALVEITGNKFDDINANGIYDGGEPGVPGVVVIVDGIDGMGNAINLNAATDAAGNFHFPDLVPGQYTVTEQVPAGTVPSTPTASGPHGLQSGEFLDLGQVFGNYRPARLSGLKFEDINANGIYDAGEPGVAGVVVTLDGTDGSGNPVNVATATDAAGNFHFPGLVPGQYTVTEQVPAGTVPSTPPSNGPHLLHSAEILDLGPVFGNYRPARLSGLKFEDINANGIYDGGEPGMSGVVVTLDGTDGSGNPVNVATATDAAGEFHFSNLVPGSYTATETVPAGMMASTPTSNGPHAVQSGNNINLGPVFGNFRPAEITGIKFEDLNQNGVLDPSELLVAGVVVTLDGTDGSGNPVNEATVTDDAGAFYFSGVIPGSYTVTEILPAGWQNTTPVSSGPHSLQSGQILDLGAVFGNYLANEPPTAVDDDYDATGNVGISIAAPGVLDNDQDPNLPGDVLTATAAVVDPTTAGGRAEIAANGSIIYTPPAGFKGQDTFAYEVCDSAPACDNGLVTITVSDMIWFIDNSAGAGDGTLASPFDSLSAFAGSGLPSSDDCIYIEETGTDYNGPLTLANGQIVVGEGSTVSIVSVCGITLALDSEPLPTTGGTHPAITNLLGDGIGLAGGNTIRGLNIGDVGGSGFRGTAVGPLSIHEVSIGDGTPSGGGIEVANSGTLDIVFDSLSANSTTDEGIRLNSVSGSFAVTATTGTISTTNVPAIDIDGNSSVNINTLTFTSVSSSGASNGIILMDTTGSFTVTGDGGGVANASGGTIQNTSGVGISLTSASDISLTQLNVNNTGDHGIDIASVTNFTFQDAQILDAGNQDDEHSVRISNLFGTSLIEDVRFDDINEDAIEYYNSAADDATRDVLMVSRVDFEDHMVGFGENGIDVRSSATALMGLVVDGSSFTINAEGALGILGSSIGSSDLSITIQNSTFNALDSFGAGTIQISNTATSTGANLITGNTINDAGLTGIIVNNDDNATSEATISNNTINGDGTPSQNGFGIQARQDEDGTYTLLSDDNDLDGFGFDYFRVFARDTTDGTGILNGTITNNASTTAPNDIGAGINDFVQDTNTICADINGNDIMGSNTFIGFDDDIIVNEGGTATLNIEQTDSTNLSNVNNTATVFVNGTPSFAVGNCPTPSP